MTYNEDSFALSRKMSEANFASNVLNREVKISDVVVDNNTAFITNLSKEESMKLEKAIKDKYTKLNYTIKHDAEFTNKEFANALQKAKVASLLDTIFYK